MLLNSCFCFSTTFSIRKAFNTCKKAASIQWQRIALWSFSRCPVLTACQTKQALTTLRILSGKSGWFTVRLSSLEAPQCLALTSSPRKGDTRESSLSNLEASFLIPLDWMQHPFRKEIRALDDRLTRRIDSDQKEEARPCQVARRHTIQTAEMLCTEGQFPESAFVQTCASKTGIHLCRWPTSTT